MAEQKKRTYTPAHKRATMKWESANIYKTTCKFPKDWELLIKKRANDLTEGSVNAYVKSLVQADLFTDDYVETENERFEDAP